MLLVLATQAQYGPVETREKNETATNHVPASDQQVQMG